MTIVNKNISDNKPSKIQTNNMTSLGNYGKNEIQFNSWEILSITGLHKSFEEALKNRLVSLKEIPKNCCPTQNARSCAMIQSSNGSRQALR